MPIREHPVREDERADIDAYVQAGLTRLGVAPEAPPSEVVRTLRTHLEAERARVNALDQEDDGYAEFILELGYVWGAQVVRHYGWHWGVLEVDGQDGGTVVIHPEGRVFVNPTRLMWEIVSRPERSNTTALIFGPLAPGVLSAQLPEGEGAPDSYAGLH